jgi:hypothetical protein
MGSGSACSRRNNFAAGALGYGLNLLSIERRFVHWAGR